ncbi:MAG TPA: type II toxin-antitoxin system HicB family antitoxin [Rhodospirillales bacterium]|jgi:predicted RNase H-like HicB family nuclease|nr:type II toxin-antitoxin system HicB family antitoxin [Rhodospirillales bacterium]
MDYIALLRKETDTDYGVDFPDLPGCITAGSTLDEAKEIAAEAIAFHIEGLIEDGEDIPAPSSLEEIMADKANKEAVAFLVPYQSSEKAVRVNITLPSSLLKRIDRQSGKRGRSGFLAAAAEKELTK